MARCIEDVTRRRPGWGVSTGACTNPGEFAIKSSMYDDRWLHVCRTHLPVLVKRLMLSPKRVKSPLTVSLTIFEEAGA